ncbi:MAG: PCYCGC domain-containing protein [bacterium]|uniref:PCYCGC domain-containing protein n=1 Tax=Candidatus Methylomirabilis tolerans TaxID=3123416 RepID=A0AAJ1AKB8_9BACT|nr:PCYCGC domain-containing protein [Candidatus Methylomirabilis sp.]
MEQDEVEQPDRRLALRILAGGLFGLLIGPVAGWAAGRDSMMQVIPRRPRPATPSPALFDGKLAQTYRIAREVPELLEQMPCYCGCGNMANHQNNLDCYVDRHADT